MNLAGRAARGPGLPAGRRPLLARYLKAAGRLTAGVAVLVVTAAVVVALGTLAEIASTHCRQPERVASAEQ